MEYVDEEEMKQLPHRHIGVVIAHHQMGAIQLGTGILISPNLVLTCAHVTHSKAYQNKPFPNIYFFPAQCGELTNYYEVEQAIIGRADSPAASATSLADLKPLKLGAAIGTTSLDYAEQVIAPDGDVQVYDDNAAAKAAFDANQVDAIVFDLPTAYYITAVEITDASIIGILPAGDSPEELGMLFEDGNPLVGCVNAALAAVRDAGTLDALAAEWLAQGGDIPTLTN